MDIATIIQHLTLNQDIIIALVALGVFLTKVAVAPSKFEIEAVSKVLIPIVAVILKRLAVFYKNHPASTHFINVENELFNLREKLGRKAKG